MMMRRLRLGLLLSLVSSVAASSLWAGSGPMTNQYTGHKHEELSLLTFAHGGPRQWGQKPDVPISYDTLRELLAYPLPADKNQSLRPIMRNTFAKVQDVLNTHKAQVQSLLQDQEIQDHLFLYVQEVDKQNIKQPVQKLSIYNTQLLKKYDLLIKNSLTQIVLDSADPNSAYGPFEAFARRHKGLFAPKFREFLAGKRKLVTPGYYPKLFYILNRTYNKKPLEFLHAEHLVDKPLDAYQNYTTKWKQERRLSAQKQAQKHDDKYIWLQTPEGMKKLNCWHSDPQEVQKYLGFVRYYTIKLVIQSGGAPQFARQHKIGVSQTRDFMRGQTPSKASMVSIWRVLRQHYPQGLDVTDANILKLDIWQQHLNNLKRQAEEKKQETRRARLVRRREQHQKLKQQKLKKPKKIVNQNFNQFSNPADSPAFVRVVNSIYNDNLEQFIELLKKMRYDLPLQNGNTALHYAAKYGAHNIMMWLLKRGVDANAANVSYETPLLWAVLSFELQAARTLLEQGAKPQAAPGMRGWLPLHEAIRELDGVATALLVQHGADVNAVPVAYPGQSHGRGSFDDWHDARGHARQTRIKNLFERSDLRPLELAFAMNNPKIIEFLRQHHAEARPELVKAYDEYQHMVPTTSLKSQSLSAKQQHEQWLAGGGFADRRRAQHLRSVLDPACDWLLSQRPPSTATALAEEASH